MQDFQDFFDKNQITGEPTPEQAAALLEHAQQGDTVTPTEPPADAPAIGAAPPAAEPTAAPAAPEPPAAPPPTLLAQDGKHTIPFQELVDARARSQTLEQQLAEANARLQAAVTAAATPPPPPPAPPIDLGAKEKLWMEAVNTGNDEAALALRGEINDELIRLAEERSTAKLTQQQQQMQMDALVADAVTYAKTVKVEYPQLDNASPQVNPQAIDFVLMQRDRLLDAGAHSPASAMKAAVEGAASLFGWKKSGAVAPSPADPRAAQAAAEAAIAKAGEQTPVTLSDIPGGRTDGRSPVEQMATIGNGPDLLSAMENMRMSPNQIETFLNRQI